jgi:hypothetical protein
MIDAVSDANTKKSMVLAITALNQEKAAFETDLKELRRLRTEMELGKDLLRKETEKLTTLINGARDAANPKAGKDGKAAPDYGMVIAFQSEATIFVAQCDAAIEMGLIERKAAKEINPNVKGAPASTVPVQSASITTAQSRGTSFYSATPGKRPDKPDMPLWTYTEHKVFIEFQKQRMVDEGMDTVMERLKADKTRVQAFAAKLQSFTGL